MNNRVASLLTAYTMFFAVAGNYSNFGNCKKDNSVAFKKVKIKGKSAEEMGTANSRKKKSRKERKKQRKNKK